MDSSKTVPIRSQLRYPIPKSRTACVAFTVIPIMCLALASGACKGSPQQGAAFRPPTLNSQGVQLATAALIEDVLMAASGTGESTLSQQQALALAKFDLAVTARTFEADYEANELSGDAKYKNKRFLLSGVIKSIEKDFTGSGFLTLSSDNLLGVRAQLNKRGTQGAISLTEGTKVFLVCRSSDRIVGAEVAGDCQRLSQYVDEIKPDLRSSVREFLEGRRSLPKKLGIGLAAAYVAGSHLSPSSTCLSQVDEKCEQELAQLKDSAQSQNLQAEVKQVEAGLKLD